MKKKTDYLEIKIKIDWNLIKATAVCGKLGQFLQGEFTPFVEEATRQAAIRLNKEGIRW